MRHITNNGRIEIKDIALPLPAGKVARSLVCVSLVDSLTEYLLESVSRERERERESNTHSCMTR
ncbi:MAG: hypothetical protein LBE55_03490 [Clostridiales bacterium]|nr:hypothetical protein [Clostridiales bacterium]